MNETKQPLSIRRFFAGKHVLLTGATGFLAKAVMEKMLHDLPDIGQIYLLIRPRFKADGSRADSRERLHEEILRNSAFGRLREKLGENFDSFCESKITCITGDLTQERLGLTETAYADLAAKIKVIINSAATVVFDERLDLALSLNTLGPSRLLGLARTSGGIYVHISTAYVSGMRKGSVPERLMDPLEAVDAQLPAGVPRPQKFEPCDEIAYLHQLAEQVKTQCRQEFEQQRLDPKSDEAKEKLNTALIKAGMDRAKSYGWNDTYTFTKFLGEQMIAKDHGDIPTVIVRPSIIESSLREPEPGWLDGLRMADPIIIGYGKGRLPDFPGNPQIVLDIIPADYVVNGVLAAAAHIGRMPGGFDLFTIASSSKNPLWLQSLYENVHDYFTKHPFADKDGRPIPVNEWHFPTIEAYRQMMVKKYLRPAQWLLKLLNGPVPIPGGRKWKPRLKNRISKIEQLIYYVDIYGPYVNLDCKFETDHAHELLLSLESEEQEAFNFDVTRFHWRNYLQDIHIPGLKRNILRMEDVPRTGASQGNLLEEEVAEGRKRAEGIRARGVPQTIVEVAWHGKERFGRKSLVEMRRNNPANGPAQVRFSYEEMFDRAGLLGKTLAAKLDLHPGDRVVLSGENCPEWALAYLAIARTGATAVPLDRSMTAAEVARIAKLVEAKAIIVSPGLWKNGAGIYGQGNGLPPGLNLIQGLTPFEGEQWLCPEANPAVRPLKDPAPEALASILFTSGTTHDPKGVMLSHSNFLANATGITKLLHPLETDRFLSVLPLHHALEFTCGFIIPMQGGATIHHVENLRGQEILDTMKLNEITVMIGVPRLFQLFRDGIKAKIDQAGWRGKLALDVGEFACLGAELFGQTQFRPRVFSKVHEAFGGKLRLFVSGGAALDADLFHFFRRFGIPVCEGYGLTETAPVLTVNPLAAAKPGSVGLAIPGMEINIKNLEDDSEIGEILARGPSVMHGYWRNPQATAAVMENGWFKTGDLGRLDNEGYLHITGRLKDVIITSAGKNVYPDDVEHHLKDVVGIKELCVVGLPGRSGRGEEVAVAIVMDAGADKDHISAKITEISRNLASHQQISRIEFLADELPKTSTLKVQRNKVRARILSGVGRADKAPPRSAAPAVRETATSSNDVFIEVARTIARVAGNLPASDVMPTQKLQMDLGIDSIGRVDILQHLESRYGITFPADAEAKVFSVQDIITLVNDAVGITEKAKTRRGRNLWERSKISRDAVEAGLRQTWSQRMTRKFWELCTHAIMSTHVRVRGDGINNLPKTGPYIIVANHSSHLDLPAVRKVIGPYAETLHAMAAKDYFFNTPLKAWFFATCMNALPLDREANAADSLAFCKTVLDNGRAILLFPEGTRSLNGEMRAFKPGIGVLAMELDVPLIPVYMHGTFQSWPKGRRLPRPGKVQVRIGPPVDFSELKALRGKTPTTELYRRAATLLKVKVEELAELPPLK